MECFHHAGTPAVGCCRACLKGICRRCATELEGGLACSEACATMVEAIVASVRQGARYQRVTGALLRSSPGLWTGLAIVALLVGAFVSLWGLSLPMFQEIAFLGLPFLALAFLSGRLARSVSAPGPDARSPRDPAAR